MFMHSIFTCTIREPPTAVLSIYFVVIYLLLYIVLYAYALQIHRGWWTSIDEGVGGSVHSHSHSDLSDFSDYFDDDDDLSLPGS